MAATECINDETWILYSEGKLSETDLQAIHAHADSCEICSDIRDGINAMKQPAQLNIHVKSIQKKSFKEKSSGKKRAIVPLFYWSAAAALVVVSGFLFLKMDGPLEERADLKSLQDTSRVEVNLKMDSLPMPAERKADRKKIASSSKIKTREFQKESQVDSETGLHNQPTPIENTESKQVQDHEQAATVIESSSQVKRLNESVDTENYKSKDIYPSNTMIRNFSLSNNQMDDANDRAETSGKMIVRNESSLVVSKDRKRTLNQTDSVMEKAVLLKKLNLPDSALTTLRSVQPDSLQSGYENYRMLEAELLDQLGKKEEADSLYRKVIRLNGKRVSEAMRKLDD